MIISVQKLTQVTKSNTAGFLRIQRHRKILLTHTHCSLLADFKNGNKNVKTFLKGEQILLLKILMEDRKNSYSNKMQPLLNASKA